MGQQEKDAPLGRGMHARTRRSRRGGLRDADDRRERHDAAPGVRRQVGDRAAGARGRAGGGCTATRRGTRGRTAAAGGCAAAGRHTAAGGHAGGGDAAAARGGRRHGGGRDRRGTGGDGDGVGGEGSVWRVLEWAGGGLDVGRTLMSYLRGGRQHEVKARATGTHSYYWYFFVWWECVTCSGKERGVQLAWRSDWRSTGAGEHAGKLIRLAPETRNLVQACRIVQNEQIFSEFGSDEIAMSVRRTQPGVQKADICSMAWPRIKRGSLTEFFLITELWRVFAVHNQVFKKYYSRGLRPGPESNEVFSHEIRELLIVPRIERGLRTQFSFTAEFIIVVYIVVTPTTIPIALQPGCTCPTKSTPLRLSGKNPKEKDLSWAECEPQPGVQKKQSEVMTWPRIERGLLTQIFFLDLGAQAVKK
ncbi:hypothetical protein B0H10DRAFT_1939187 [Mycena sp. CBHHK59/15]|nr:hypothetical protein B0H10DRAFT_1939187 [Mycena sp. CBHHK59/15]